MVGVAVMCKGGRRVPLGSCAGDPCRDGVLLAGAESELEEVSDDGVFAREAKGVRGWGEVCRGETSACCTGVK